MQWYIKINLNATIKIMNLRLLMYKEPQWKTDAVANTQ